MTEATAAVLLQSIVGTSSRCVGEMMDYFGSALAVFEAGDNERRLSGIFSQTAIGRFAAPDLASAEKTVSQCQREEIKILPYSSDEYPERLRSIDSPPLVLFVKGELGKVDEQVCIGMVGTRKPSDYGRECAVRLSGDLAAEGAVIVSGGALGIDAAAHSGALMRSGKTICVLGCGISYPYLPANANLRDSVSKNGALVSEYPPSAPPLRYTFSARNRIIAGLSLGTVVVEAGEGSGALITASHAKNQNRDLFCVTGGMLSSGFAGSNKLLASGQAMPVFCAEDILKHYRADYTLTPPSPSQEMKSDDRPASDSIGLSKKFEQETFILPEPGVQLSEVAARLYSAFKAVEEHKEKIIARSGLSAREALSALTELEIKGVVTAVGGGRLRI